MRSSLRRVLALPRSLTLFTSQPNPDEELIQRDGDDICIDSNTATDLKETIDLTNVS